MSKPGRPLPEGDPRHGSNNGYTNWGCRCDPCRVAATSSSLSSRAKRQEPSTHGLGGYRNYGCRCAICGEAARLADADRYKSNRDHVLAGQKRWRGTPAGRAITLAGVARRRAREKELDCGCVTAERLMALWETAGGACSYCASPAEHYDHVVPLAKQGKHCLENLTPACASCNKRKRTRSADQFRAILALEAQGAA